VKLTKHVLVLLLAGLAAMAVPAAEDVAPAGKCMTCHKEKSPGLYRQWYQSAHALHKVTCIDCHRAAADDPDGYEHYGVRIATLVTPRDCGRCHKKEMEEVDRSYHAQAGLILESQDAYLAHVGAGEPVAIQGCESCHGTKVKLDADSPNKLSMKSWPNSGIGRLNPDGSKGSCNACHTRHSFSRAQARQPEACGKCHLGPDHPQKEIYEESKHGNTYFTNMDKMNLDADRWVVGEDYFVAPTCASCHLSATVKQKATHDVGERIAWTLRPVVSVYKENWQSRRTNMMDVCSTCHGSVFVRGHFYQFDASVRLYNEKFIAPATDIMNLIRKKNLLANPAAFGNDIEWIYWELWHHEGRRARHGAAMMGPDYTWWHGFYEVVKHFYFKFLPAARAYGDPEINDRIHRLLADDPMHQWLNRSADDLKAAIRSGDMQKLYQQFYGQGQK